MRKTTRLLSLLLSVVFIVSTACFLCGCKQKTANHKYQLSLVYDDGIVEGKLRYKFINKYKVVIDCLKFNLHANTYSKNSKILPTTANNLAKAYPSGVSYGGVEIVEVLSNGNNLSYQTYEDNSFLKVEVEPIAPNTEQEIEITFKTTLPNSILRLGKNSSCVNLADFFPTACYFDGEKFIETPYSPIGDPYFLDACDYQVSLTVPSTLIVASSGYPTQTEVGDTTTTYSYQLSSGRNFAFCLSDKYNLFSKTIDGTTFNYYSFASDQDEVLNFICDCYNFYKKTFGSIPYKSVSVCESDFLYGGMEFSGLCFIKKDLPIEQLKLVISHELAHQWWHGAVGVDGYNDGYVDEGLAEFSSYLYFLQSDKEVANQMISNAKSAYKSFFKVEELLNGNANTSMNRPLNEFESEYEYVNIAYNKSLIAFYQYLQSVGNQKVLKRLKKLYEDNYLKILNRERLLSALGYEQHFNSFIDGKVII